MAKRTRRPPRARPAATAPTADDAEGRPPEARVVRGAPDVEAPPDARPRFWQDFSVSWTKLVVVRLVFFGLLAADAFRQLAHSARYGAGGFNVPQIGWLPLPAPDRVAMIAIHGGLALAFALIAQGVAVQRLLPIATALYGYAYFVSQLDSYQHHYLVFLLLVLWCFVPRAPVVSGGVVTVRSWALRLVLVQLAIVYLWAAIAKIDPLWFDGTALTRQVQPGWVRNLITDVGFDTVAAIVLTTELALAATVWWRRLWWIALPLGVGLHAGIELVGLEIGLFSYLMFAVYLLVVPDGVYEAIARATRRAIDVARGPQIAWLVGGGVAALAASIAFLRIPLPLTIPLGVAAVVVGLEVATMLERRDRGRAGRTLAALAVAAALPVVLTYATDTVLDHYRFRAGAARRLGDDRGARASYEGMLAIDPSSEYAHYYLGGLEGAAGNLDAAIAHYHRAQRAAPRRARSFVAEARLVQGKGDLAGAQALVRDALAADPSDAEALELEKSMQSMAPAEGPSPAPPAPAPAAAPALLPGAAGAR